MDRQGLRFRVVNPETVCGQTGRCVTVLNSNGMKQLAVPLGELIGAVT